MKNLIKILVALLIIMLIVGAFAPLAFADSNNENSNKPTSEEKAERKASNDEKKAERELAKDEAKEERQQRKVEFLARKLERAQIRIATKAELKAQHELIAGYKLELQAMRQFFEALTEEEIATMTEEDRAAYKAEVNALKQEIKSTQKYRLEIIAEAHREIKEIFPGVRASGIPTEDEVEEVEEIIDAL